MEDRIEGGPLHVGRQPPAAELVKEAIEQTRELVQIEIALARDEIGDHVAKARVGAVALGAAAALALAASTMGLVAVAAAFVRVWLAALVVAGISMVAPAGGALSMHAMS